MTEEAESPYSEVIPNLQIAWDSTSLGYLKTCPRLYQYKMLEGWVPKRAAAPLEFGIMFHSAIEEYDKRIAAGDDFKTALRAATRRALIDSREEKTIRQCGDCEAELQEDAAYCGYCGSEDVSDIQTWEPWSSHDTRRTRETLVRSVVWYLDNYASNDPLKTYILPSGEPAIEQSFHFDLDIQADTGEVFSLSGHFDKIAEQNGQVYVQDRKTTGSTLSSYYFEGFTPDNQMSLYTLASRVVFSAPAVGTVIDAAQLAVNFTRFSRGYAHRTEDQLNEWLYDTKFWLKQAEVFAKADYWPMNDKSCNQYGGCEFRKICGADPAVRETLLQSDFIKKSWNPLSKR